MKMLYIPCKDKREALLISGLLLDKKLIACANIYDSLSLYDWKGKRQKQTESVIIAKTQASKVAAARKLILAAHSYDVPAILVMDAESINPEYSKWLIASISSRER